MMKRITFSILGLLLLTASNTFADDVSIDSSGNVKTGVANTSAELEVTGASGEDGIMGSASGTGGAGLYGINTTYGNYGIVGDDNYGVFGYSLGGWAGYFQGNARVTGDLTVDGAINVTENDPQVGTLTNGMWCTTNGTQVNCTSAAPVTSETDPQVGGNTTNFIPKWNGSGLVTGAIYDNGNVGIGTAAPNEQLEITGNLRLPETTATTGIIKSGSDTLMHTFGGISNFFAGINAGNLSMTGLLNTAIGYHALFSNTTGDSNTAGGYKALYSNTTGDSNTAAGYNALRYNTIGSYNTAGGNDALRSNTTANKNTAIGRSSLYTQSYDNGGTAWDSNNTAVGFESLYSNQPTSAFDGRYNTAVGSFALRSNTTGFYNTATGYNALYSNTTGYSNTASGYYALPSNTTGTYNTASGRAALSANSTGSSNTATGVNALVSNTTGNNNTAIGYGADVSSGNLTNATAIGYLALVNASNKVAIGNSAVTSIGGYAAWSNFSDFRSKTDIQDIGYGLDLIKQLRPVSFRMKDGNGNTDFGFVAQDIESLLGEKYNVLDIGGGEDRMLSLRYSQFIAPMVKAIQDQQEIIDSQQARIESQQEQIDALKNIVDELRKRL